MKLFGYLPESLFFPLAGPKKHVYARLLLHLYNRVFAARILETPTKEDVLGHVSVALAEAGVDSPDQLAEDGQDGSAGDQAHSLAYRRLRDTGWLIEEREKWRVLVEMHPDAFMLLGAIAEFHNSRLRVAGAVVEVKSNLEAAANDPTTLAQGLTNAHDTAVRFARGMRRILVGMHGIEDQILGNPNAAAILRTFFEDFVNGLLIADYKQLKTSNNPYRYRRQISALAADLLHNMEWRGVIARAYIEQGVVPTGTSIVTAEERVVTELDKIRQVFEDVGSFMERIESFRDRLERRVRMTVHYMDMVGEGAVERIARLIEKLGAVTDETIDIQLRAPDVGFPITALALYMPPPPRGAPEKTRFKLPQPDPYLKAYIAATSEFDAMVRVTQARLKAFIDHKLGARDQLRSCDIVIDSIEDLLAYRALPVGVFGSAKVLGPYRVVLEDGRTENPWIDVPAFRIERVAAGRPAAC
jgi:Family of unknown function (DUF5716)